MTPITLQRTFVLDAAIKQLWPLLSDTNRVNRLMGLPPAKRFEPGQDGGRVVHSHYLGVPVTWHEAPFEWIFEQWFGLERVLDAPVPVERIFVGAHFNALSDAQTQIVISARVVPRNAAGWLAGRLVVGQKMLRDMERAFRTLGAAALANDGLVPAARTPAVNHAQLTRGTQQLADAGVPRVLVERLAQHLRAADDPGVLRMRPFALADVWHESRDKVLHLFLHATRVGLLDMEWDVICPSCRGMNAQVRTLDALAEHGACPACSIEYNVSFDETVELRFSVSSTVRQAFDVSYCVGGPANSRHIGAQLWLAPHAERSVTLRLARGRYRLHAPRAHGSATLDVTTDAQADTAHIRLREHNAEDAPHILAAGPATLVLENVSAAPLLVVLEEDAWSTQAASAAQVTALEEFRRLFSSEVLTPGIGMAVRNLTFLFSDLKESTKIYDTIGDAPAYARVRDHFDSMRRIISQHNGALVKTIGDAVMAVFSSAEDGLRAALAIQHEFISGEIARGHPALRVKLGLHRGPCIAVNANAVLDYFGATVNIAARTQGESTGGDIVITADVLADPGVQQVLARANVASETFERTLRGMRQQFTLCRLWSSERDALRRSEREQHAREPVALGDA